MDKVVDDKVIKSSPGDESVLLESELDTPWVMTWLPYVSWTPKWFSSWQSLAMSNHLVI